MKKLFFMLPALVLALATVSCDKCKKADCQNNASCEKKEGKCNCTEFYEGDKCENEIRKNYYGKYSGNVTLSGSEVPVPVTLSSGGSSASALNAELELIGGKATLLMTLSDPTNYTTNEVSMTIVSPMDKKNLDVKVSGTGTVNASTLTGTFLIKGDFLRNGVEVPITATYSGTK
jgi:hypothetical protein